MNLWNGASTTGKAKQTVFQATVFKKHFISPNVMFRNLHAPYESMFFRTLILYREASE